MDKENHKISIEAGKFFMVCRGEGYSTEVVDGKGLLQAVIIAIYGDVSNCPKDHMNSYQADLNEPDNWCHDEDHGATVFTTNVGETGRIEIFRIV